MPIHFCKQMVLACTVRPTCITPSARFVFEAQTSVFLNQNCPFDDFEREKNHFEVFEKLA